VNPQIKERDPEGIVRRKCGAQLHAAQRDHTRGDPGAFCATRLRRTRKRGRPLVLFELTNQGDTPLHLVFLTRKWCACGTIAATWCRRRYVMGDRETRVQRASIVMGQRYRMIFELPAGAAPYPGSMDFKRGLCPVPDYGAETRFEVTK